MSRFNQVSVANQHRTINRAGGRAYKLSPEMELYSRVCTATLFPKYYEAPAETIHAIRRLVSECDPEFVAKLAVYAREEMHLRTIPLVLSVELAKIHSRDNLISHLTERVIQRADELAEILVCYELINKRTGTKKLNMLSNQLRKGIARAI
tara:strand:+ start:174 stop:626 length:453 start_codon:yes stop_codon:yes gene_type:complete